MPRYKLTIAYDGTGFNGWQKQAGEGEEATERPSDEATEGGTDVGAKGCERESSPTTTGLNYSERVIDASAGGESASLDECGSPLPSSLPLRTVQGVVERAVREVVREPVILLGASRTDSGVHARGQVAAFTCSEARRGAPEDRLKMAINSRLPEDVLVTACERVRDDFDPIGDCTSKGYRYTIRASRDRALWDRNYVHRVWAALDERAMHEAAQRLVGEHDFAAFAAAGHGRLTTVRTVLRCEVTRPRTPAPAPGDTIFIDVSGTGFLYNMVRIIAGTLINVGNGKMTPEDVSAALASKDRRMAGPTAPARGLCLEWVEYGERAMGNGQ